MMTDEANPNLQPQELQTITQQDVGTLAAVLSDTPSVKQETSIDPTTISAPPPSVEAAQAPTAISALTELTHAQALPEINAGEVMHAPSFAPGSIQRFMEDVIAEAGRIERRVMAVVADHTGALRKLFVTTNNEPNPNPNPTNEGE